MSASLIDWARIRKLIRDSLVGQGAIQGQQGLQGPIGPKGDMGSTGPQGSQGNPGPQGQEGIQGPPGSTGAIGPMGQSGAPVQVRARGNWNSSVTDYERYDVVVFESLDGYSNSYIYSYDIPGNQIPPLDANSPWVLWVMQGPEGPQGVQGVKGDQGAVGPKGAQGDQGPIGPTGDQKETPDRKANKVFLEA